MGSVNVSQVVDYEGYSQEYAYATITWDESLKVTVNVTSSNILTWRIRGRGSDTREYCVGTGGARTGTFNAENGKDYVFQIYSQTYSKYSDGDFFTVESGSSGGNSGGSDSGDSGGGNTSTSAHYLYIDQGEGTIIKVERTWSDYGNYTGSNGNWDEKVFLSHQDYVYYPSDRFQITIEPSAGYEIDDYELYNLVKPSDAEPYQLSTADYAGIYATATPKQYKLSATTGVGSYIIVERISSKREDAELGVLANGAAIYHFDVLKITYGVEAGYEAVNGVISGCIENSDDTFTVVGNTTITLTTKQLGLVYIDDGTTFLRALLYIDNGTSWNQCIPYIDNGTSWDLCS